MPTLLRLAAAILIGLVLFAPARAGASIRVLGGEARPDFPQGITFELEAEAGAADIAAVQLLYGAAREQVLTVVDLPVTPGRSVKVSHQLDTQVYYFPPGTAISYHWVISDGAGNVLTTEPQQLIYHDARFPWSELSERNVTVFWYRGGEAFGQELIGVVGRALDRLEAQVGAGLADPVRIYVYADGRDMRTALARNSVEWVGGEAHPSLGVIVGAIAPGDAAEAGRLLPHELSHQVLHQATDNPYGGLPLWFDEGLAVHHQEQRDSGWDEMVAEAAREGRLIPLEALAASFPADTEQALLSYAQSRDMVEYIIGTFGEDKVRELAAAFAAATPVEEAVPQVLGRTVDELDAEWRATLPEQAAAPPATAAPQSAPLERFEDGPVAPLGQAELTPAWWGLAGLPAWVVMGAVGLCCLGGAAAAGALGLVALRLVGGDKRTR